VLKKFKNSGAKRLNELMEAKRLRAHAVSLLLMLEFPEGNLGMETSDHFFVILIVVILRRSGKNSSSLFLIF
jgi:hypothetical protein